MDPSPGGHVELEHVVRGGGVDLVLADRRQSVDELEDLAITISTPAKNTPPITQPDGLVSSRIDPSFSSVSGLAGRQCPLLERVKLRLADRARIE